MPCHRIGNWKICWSFLSPANERLQVERVEADRIEAERLVAECIDAKRIEAERIAVEKRGRRERSQRSPHPSKTKNRCVRRTSRDSDLTALVLTSVLRSFTPPHPHHG